MTNGSTPERRQWNISGIVAYPVTDNVINGYTSAVEIRDGEIIIDRETLREALRKSWPELPNNKYEKVLGGIVSVGISTHSGMRGFGSFSVVPVDRNKLEQELFGNEEQP